MPIVRDAEVTPTATAPGLARRVMAHPSMGIVSLFSGTTVFEPGAEVRLHYHNCDEVITISEGSALCEIEGEVFELGPYDTAVVPAGSRHRFWNPGPGVMRLVWVYPRPDVERIYVE